MATLSFGFLPYAIYLQRGSTLIIENLYMTDAPYPSLEYLNNTKNNFYGARNRCWMCLMPHRAQVPHRLWECSALGWSHVAEKRLAGCRQLHGHRPRPLAGTADGAKHYGAVH